MITKTQMANHGKVNLKVCSRCLHKSHHFGKCPTCGIELEEMCPNCGNALANCGFVKCPPSKKVKQ